MALSLLLILKYTFYGFYLPDMAYMTGNIMEKEKKNPLKHLFYKASKGFLISRGGRNRTILWSFGDPWAEWFKVALLLVFRYLYYVLNPFLNPLYFFVKIDATMILVYGVLYNLLIYSLNNK